MSLISVSGVYNIGASIGRDFESIINKYGSESVASLMHKVISVLEDLEKYANHFESEEREINLLRTTINRLEFEKEERFKDQENFDKEIIQLETNWRNESQELSQLIKKLEDENNQLREAIKNKVDFQDLELDDQSGNNGEEIQIMLRLKDLVDRQKAEIRSLKRQIIQKNVDLEAIQQQANRLAQLNAELRRKYCICKKRTDELLEDKTDLELQLQSKEDTIRKMKDYIYNPDEVKSLPPSIIQPIRKILGLIDQEGQQDPMSTSLIIPSTSSGITSDLSGNFDDSLTSPTLPLAKLTEDQFIKKLNHDDKMIIDKKDLNRPRFTVNELRKILLERNELRSKLVEIEEELAVYRRAGDEEPQVQGPINKEPDEKLNNIERNGEGFIKNFFKNIVEKLNK